MLAGTPGYQSPEQLKAESVGIPSKVYAFGGVLACAVWGEATLGRIESLPNHVQSDHGKQNPNQGSHRFQNIMNGTHHELCIFCCFEYWLRPPPPPPPQQFVRPFLLPAAPLILLDLSHQFLMGSNLRCHVQSCRNYGCQYVRQLLVASSLLIEELKSSVFVTGFLLWELDTLLYQACAW